MKAVYAGNGQLDARQDNEHQQAQCYDSSGQFTPITQFGVDLLENRQQGDSDDGSPYDRRDKRSENLEAPTDERSQNTELDGNVDCFMG
jgi:hypothetical protein